MVPTDERTVPPEVTNEECDGNSDLAATLEGEIDDDWRKPSISERKPVRFLYNDYTGKKSDRAMCHGCSPELTPRAGLVAKGK